VEGVGARALLEAERDAGAPDKGQLHERLKHRRREIPHQVGSFRYGAGEHGDRPRDPLGVGTSAGTVEYRPLD
jgi:hypothetical protein